MSSAARTAHPTRPVARRTAAVVGLFLLASSAVIVGERLHTYDEPFESDIGFYAVVGHELLSGRRLYSDLWDNRPPGTNVVYAGAELIAGGGRRSIFLIGVVAGLVTLAGTFAAAASAASSTAAGLWAALFWTITCGDLQLQANQPNAEVLINGSLVWALALFLGWPAERSSLRRAVACGAFLAYASLCKPFLLVSAVLFAAVHLAFPPRGQAHRRSALVEAGACMGVIVIVWAAAAGYFVLTDRGQVFYDAMVTYNLAYASPPPYSQGMLHNVLAGLQPEKLVPSSLRFALPLGLLSMLGAALSALENRRSAGLLGAAFAAAVIEVALPGKFIEHYYQLWLPPLCVGAGIALGLLATARIPGGLLAATAAGTAALVLVAHHELPFYRLPAVEWSQRKYGEEFVAEVGVARKIDELLAPGETFYVAGRNISLYFETRRDPPTGVLFFKDILKGPFSESLSRRVISDLERARPELVVVNDRVVQQAPDHPVLLHCLRHYDPFFRKGPFQLYARHGGELQARSTAVAGSPATGEVRTR